MRYWDYYEPSVPREVKGGIRAQSKRGAFAEKWWAKRWIAVLEGFRIGARLGRGRSYARKGQVISIDVAKGAVQAAVQGSRRTPYQVKIDVKKLSSKEWKKVVESLGKRPLFTAKLLAGEMPHEIEEAFGEAGASLFPARPGDLRTDCNCPDWSNPCKHIAAVFYLLGEEFDRDPFLMFTLRGMERGEMLELLGGGSGNSIDRQTIPEREEPSPEPLPVDAESFWRGGGGLPDDLFGEVVIPKIAAALPKRLGKFPFWRGEVNLLDVIEPVYAGASEEASSVFLNERRTQTGGLEPISM